MLLYTAVYSWWVSWCNTIYLQLHHNSSPANHTSVCLAIKYRFTNNTCKIITAITIFRKCKWHPHSKPVQNVRTKYIGKTHCYVMSLFWTILEYQ